MSKPLINYTASEKKRLEKRAAKHLGNFEAMKDKISALGFDYDSNKPQRGDKGYDILKNAYSEKAKARKILISLGIEETAVKPLRKRKHSKAKIRRQAKPKVNRQTKSNVEWLPRDEWERQTAKFYSSREWREIRYEALRNTGAVCSCCGARASDGVRIHVDHIKPRSKYPELQLDIDNLQVLCEDCNLGKSNYYDDDWRVKMQG